MKIRRMVSRQVPPSAHERTRAGEISWGTQEFVLCATGSSGDREINFFCLDFETLQALCRILRQPAMCPSWLRGWRFDMKRLAVSAIALAALATPSLAADCAK